MILEAAYLDVRSGQERAFETACSEAKSIIPSMLGFVPLELQRYIDIRTRHRLLVKWMTFERHTLGFRYLQSFSGGAAVASPLRHIPNCKTLCTCACSQTINPKRMQEGRFARPDARDRELVDAIIRTLGL